MKHIITCAAAVTLLLSASAFAEPQYGTKSITAPSGTQSTNMPAGTSGEVQATSPGVAHVNADSNSPSAMTPTDASMNKKSGMAMKKKKSSASMSNSTSMSSGSMSSGGGMNNSSAGMNNGTVAGKTTGGAGQ